MKQFIRNYFTFNKRERNGIVVLLGIITLQLLYLTFSDKFHTPETIDFSDFKKEIEKKESVSPKEKATDNYNEEVLIANKTSLINTSKAVYFKFNPNNLSEKDWQRLGLSEKQIRVIKNYEAKGGKFYNKEDVKKMYCISPKQYEALDSYIDIPAIATKKVTAQPLKAEIKTYNSETIDINTADSSQLVQLKGVGSFYAKKIIKLRNSLGGFINKNQLLELWKFDDNKLKEIEKNITVDVNKVKKRNINTLTAKELKHPYLSWNQANAIVYYKNKHGNYRTIEEIKKTDVIDEETYLKIAPYLTIE
jgi:competence ComEA-like helix-hairpin-helix protein